VVRDHHGIRVEECERCNGMFLRHGELNKIAEPTQGDLEFSTLHRESFDHPDRFEPIECPGCRGGDMQKVEFNIHTGIVLDYCPACEGFWLDGTELDRINDEVKALDEAAEPGPDSGMLWFARFIWSLPR
jgi:Zn-finger nucleic acid-binding protein